VFIFGSGGASKRLYWSTFDPGDSSGYGQTFWDLVQGGPPVSQVLGAKVWERSPTERHIILFVRTPEHKLQFLTFDLERQVWSDPTDLSLPPGDASSIEVVVSQTNSTNFPVSQPAFLFLRAQDNFYERWLNADATGWSDGDWPSYRLDPQA